MATLLPITLSTAAGAALLSFWLGMRVGEMRRRHKVALGDGGVPAVIARMRAQANFTEYAPLFVLLVLAVELAIGSPAWLWAVALAFLAVRVSHAFGMDGRGVTRLRMAGIVGTFTLLCGLALFAIYLAASG